MLYGHSFAFLLGQLLALQTAGFNNVSYSGPQIGLIGAPVWDRYVTGFPSSLTPTRAPSPRESWLGPIYQFDSYGDMLRAWVTPDFMQPFALLALLDQENGKTTHANAARWFAVNAVRGRRRRSDDERHAIPGHGVHYAVDSLLPAARPDGRRRNQSAPTFPTTFSDPGAGRIVAHSDWSATNTMFDYRASWKSINHQDGDGGQFEFFRKGEWLTKEMSNYDNNLVGLTTAYHNTLALQNWCADGTPTVCNWFETGEWANGSQWILGENAGDPVTVTSTGPAYAYAFSNLTKLFNRPGRPNAAGDDATDIAHASQSILLRVSVDPQDQSACVRDVSRVVAGGVRASRSIEQLRQVAERVGVCRTRTRDRHRITGVLAEHPLAAARPFFGLEPLKVRRAVGAPVLQRSVL